MSRNKVNPQKGVIGFITVIILTIVVFNVIAAGFYDSKLVSDQSTFTYGDYAPASSTNPALNDPARIQKDLKRQLYMDRLGLVIGDYYRANARFLDSALVDAAARNNARAIIKSDLLRILNNVEIDNDVKVHPLESVNIYVTDSRPLDASNQIFSRRIFVWVLGQGQFLDGPRSASETGDSSRYTNTTGPVMDEVTGAIKGCTKNVGSTMPTLTATAAPAGNGASLLTGNVATVPVTGPATLPAGNPYVDCDPTRFYSVTVSGTPIQLEYYRQTTKKLDYLAFKFAAYFKARQGTLPFRDLEINYFRPTVGGCAATTTELPCLDTFTDINLSSTTYIKGLVGISESDAFSAWGDSILISNTPPANYPWTMQIRAPLPWAVGGVIQNIDITAVQQL